MPTAVARRHVTEDLMAICDSNFERDVLSRLLRDGFDANPQFPAAGYKIDIVVDGEDDRRLAIELDGDVYHPPEQYAKDMERQQQLEKIGFKFWRCWWSEWILQPEFLLRRPSRPSKCTRNSTTRRCAKAKEQLRGFVRGRHGRHATNPSRVRVRSSEATKKTKWKRWNVSGKVIARGPMGKAVGPPIGMDLVN